MKRTTRGERRGRADNEPAAGAVATNPPPRKQRWRELHEPCPVCGAAMHRACYPKKGRVTNCCKIPAKIERMEPAARIDAADYVDPTVPAGHEWMQPWLWDEMPPV